MLATHRQQNSSILTLLTPIEPKTWPLTFSLITTTRYVVDRSNYIFSESLKEEESVGMVFENIEATFNLTPVNTLCNVTQASCTGYNPAEIWNIGPWSHTNIIKSSCSLYLFSWVILLASGLQPKAKEMSLWWKGLCPFWHVYFPL